jgi:hypothetical protein
MWYRWLPVNNTKVSEVARGINKEDFETFAGTIEFTRISGFTTFGARFLVKKHLLIYATSYLWDAIFMQYPPPPTHRREWVDLRAISNNSAT